MKSAFDVTTSLPGQQSGPESGHAVSRHLKRSNTAATDTRIAPGEASSGTRFAGEAPTGTRFASGMAPNVARFAGNAIDTRFETDNAPTDMRCETGKTTDPRFAGMAPTDTAFAGKAPAHTRFAGEDRRFEPGTAPTDTRSAEALDDELRSIAGAQAELDVRSARCLRAIEQDATWRHFGYPTILAYLEARLGICPRTARDRLRVARELSSLPLVEAALASGAISHSVVRELCRVADAQTEAAWLERACGKNLKQVQDLVRGRRKGSLPDDDRQPELETRRLTIEVSPATYALYRQTRSALSSEVGRHVDEDELIATMCRRTLEPAVVEPSRAPHQIALTVCESCRRGWQDGAGAVIEVDPVDVEVALCDAEHIGSLDAEQPARAHQDVSPATRRLVWRRDHGKCRVDGCRSARNLDVHHVVPRADGGGHDASNLVVMCSGCHAALHRGLIEVSGAAPSFVFRHLDPTRASIAVENCVEISSPTDATRSEPNDDVAIRRDAVACLKASGYASFEAKAAVDQALLQLGTIPSLEDLLRASFRCSRVPK